MNHTNAQQGIKKKEMESVRFAICTSFNYRDIYSVINEFSLFAVKKEIK